MNEMNAVSTKTLCDALLHLSRNMSIKRHMIAYFSSKKKLMQKFTYILHKMAYHQHAQESLSQDERRGICLE